MTEPPMSAAEVTAVREQLGATTEDLAAELALTPHVVRAWEEGRVRVPPRHAQLLRWRAAVAERQRALAESGLPQCGWVARWAAGPAPGRAAQQALMAHAAVCPTCVSRARYIDEHFPPLPPRPLGAPARALAWLLRRPAWMRPVIIGAALVGTVVTLRVLPLATSAGGGGALRMAAIVLLGAAAGAYVGAVGGLAFTIARRPLRRRLGRAGDVVTGVVCALVYMLSVAIPMEFIGGSTMWRDPETWLLFGGLGLLFGLFLAFGTRSAMRERSGAGGAGGGRHG
ncbi:MAG TPA: hypothetical protein VF041_16925 [Gemmatimonadaceae bacterium]